jgi:hypothetical protein
MEIRNNADGSSVLVGSAAELAEYIRAVAQDDASAPTKDDGRAKVGQVIGQGTRFKDLPKGIRILDAGTGDGLRYRHTSRDGTKFYWSMVAHVRPDEADFSRTNSTARLWTDMTVKEVW